MMHSKGFLLLTILLGIVIYSTFAQSNRRGGSALNSKEGSATQGTDDGEQSGTDDETNDKDSESGKSNKKNRSRPIHLKLPWTATYDEIMNAVAGAQMQRLNAIAQQRSSSIYTNNPMVTAAPTCHTLIDTKYPIFSDMCGAVPQARYILPNTFGHNDRWVLSHILTTLMSSSTDQTCTRSLRVLLCPMLFQPCRLRYEPPLILPCQAFCRAVKAQCASPALDVIPCDILPYASDLCPVNQPINPFLPSTTAPAATQPSVPNPAPPSDSQTARSYVPQASQQNVQSTAQAQTTSGSAGAQYNRVAMPMNSVNSIQADKQSRAALEDYLKTAKYVPSQIKTYPAAEVQQTNEARLAAGSATPVAKA